MEFRENVLFTILMIVAILIGVPGGIAIYSNVVKVVEEGSLSGANTDYQILTGTPSALILQPTSYSVADATTTPTFSATDTTVNIGNASSTGGTISQLVIVENYTDYMIFATLRGGTATSTWCYSPRWSFDGTTYNSSTANATSTDLIDTTLVAVHPQEFCFDPGTSTTTFALSGSIPAAKSARFLVKSDNATTDPNDGVEGFITVSLKDVSGQ